MYIYERRGWPKFIWNEQRLFQPLVQVRHRQGRLIGQMEGLGFSLRTEAEKVVAHSAPLGLILRRGALVACRGDLDKSPLLSRFSVNILLVSALLEMSLPCI